MLMTLIGTFGLIVHIYATKQIKYASNASAVLHHQI